MRKLDAEIKALAANKGFCEGTLKPWEFTPWEVYDGPCPYPPNGAGEQWEQALNLRHELVREIQAAKAKPKRRR